MSEQHIRGGRELSAFLKSLAPKVETKIMRSGLRAGANVFKNEVQATIPVKSGALKRSAKVSTSAKRGVITAKVKVGGKKAPHAHLVEFGTKPHKISPQGAGGLLIGGNLVGAADHPGARPHPFMRPAFDAKAPEAVAAVAAQLRKRLTQEGINVPAPEGQ